MLVRAVSLLLLTSFLSGCGGLIIYDGSRKASREVISKVMVETTPGLAPDAAADCIVKGMTVTEVVELGTSDTRRVLPKHRILVTEVMTRDGVSACLAGVPKAGS